MTEKSLRRYTSLPILLDILNRKSLTLLDPRFWDDKNDSYFLELYKKHLKLKSVLALCFAEAAESYHHWKIYSGSPSGVCIEFEKDILLNCIDGVKGFRADKVKYKEIDRLKNDDLDIRQLPFIKRYAFKDELEFRLIYESKLENIPSKDVPIYISGISRIIFNPWVPKSVYDSVKAVIEKIDGCNTITIIQTSLIENNQWKKIGENKLSTLRPGLT